MAQEVGYPNWKSEEDFRHAEASVNENILWLEENPMATSTNDTKAKTEYVLFWLTNTPYLSVTLDEEFLSGITNSKKYKFGEKYRVTYLFGKSHYIISNQENPNEAEASARGIIGMVKVYGELKKVDPSVKHRLLEKYSRLIRQGKIEGYTESQLLKAKNEPFVDPMDQF